MSCLRECGCVCYVSRPVPPLVSSCMSDRRADGPRNTGTITRLHATATATPTAVPRRALHTPSLPRQLGDRVLATASPSHPPLADSATVSRPARIAPSSPVPLGEWRSPHGDDDTRTDGLLRMSIFFLHSAPNSRQCRRTAICSVWYEAGWISARRCVPPRR